MLFKLTDFAAVCNVTINEFIVIISMLIMNWKDSFTHLRKMSTRDVNQKYRAASNHAVLYVIYKINNNIINSLISGSFCSVFGRLSAEWLCAEFVNISAGRQESTNRSCTVSVLRYDSLSSLSERPEPGLGLSLPANMQEGGE